MKSKIVIEINNTDNRFFNNLYKENIVVYKSYINGTNYYLVIDKSDYQKVKNILFEYRVRKYQEYGISYVKSILKKYKINIISIVAGLLIILLSSFFIVDIDVIHEDESVRDLIYEQLEKNGIHKYQFKKSYSDLQKIKNKIKNDNLDQIEWIEINTHGMNYIVKVEQRIINKSIQKEKYCHIYANKDGLVKSFKVYKGESLININDYVKTGDILISGDVKRDNQIVSQVCADGVIFAQRWYTVNVKIPLEYKKEIVTNKKRYNIVFNYDGVDYKLFNDRLINYKSTSKKIFDLLGLKIYLKKDILINKVKSKHTLNEALEIALKKSKEKVSHMIDQKDKAIMQKVLQKQVKDSTMIVDIFIVTEEQIGYQKIEKGE